MLCLDRESNGPGQGISNSVVLEEAREEIIHRIEGYQPFFMHEEIVNLVGEDYQLVMHSVRPQELNQTRRL